MSTPVLPIQEDVGSPRLVRVCRFYPEIGSVLAEMGMQSVLDVDVDAESVHVWADAVTDVDSALNADRVRECATVIIGQTEAEFRAGIAAYMDRTRLQPVAERFTSGGSSSASSSCALAVNRPTPASCTAAQARVAQINKRTYNRQASYNLDLVPRT